MSNKNLSWEDVKERYEKKSGNEHRSKGERELSTPDEVSEYIEKHPLSDGAKIELLSTPELVFKYMKKHGLSHDELRRIVSMRDGGK